MMFWGNAKRQFQSTPPARGATFQVVRADIGHGISIHAPREGGDLAADAPFLAAGISIHAPREGGDVDDVHLALDVGISIHAPREGGDAVRFPPDGSGAGISIHAPREGGDVSGEKT